MDKKRFIMGLSLMFCALMIGACDMVTGDQGPVEVPESAGEAEEVEMIGLANPASVFCEDQGYMLEIRSDADGNQYGVCIFPDGSECEEWAYFRGECAPSGEADIEVVEDEPAEEIDVPDVVFEGVSFSYDNALASAWTAEIVPAYNGAQEWESVPSHIEFAFEGYAHQNTLHEPRITIYPVEDYEIISSRSETLFAEMQQLLAARPDLLPGPGFTSPDVPFLPWWNAGQMIRSNGVYLDFQNGAGVRFLTQYGQAYYPINNYDHFYTFQGMTDDGLYYVAVVMPVSNPILPADGMEIPGDDPAAFGENFDTYAADIAQQLEAQPADSFTPDLALLDAMIQSLLVNPTQ